MKIVMFLIIITLSTCTPEALIKGVIQGTVDGAVTGRWKRDSSLDIFGARCNVGSVKESQKILCNGFGIFNCKTKYEHCLPEAERRCSDPKPKNPQQQKQVCDKWRELKKKVEMEHAGNFNYGAMGVAAGLSEFN